MSNLLKEVKLTASEETVLTIIVDKGQYVWQEGIKGYVPKTVLKELMWRDFIERKPTYANVFVAKFWGNKVIEYNNNVRSLKNILTKGGKNGK